MARDGYGASNFASSGGHARPERCANYPLNHRAADRHMSFSGADRFAAITDIRFLTPLASWTEGFASRGERRGARGIARRGSRYADRENQGG